MTPCFLSVKGWPLAPASRLIFLLFELIPILYSLRVASEINIPSSSVPPKCSHKASTVIEPTDKPSRAPDWRKDALPGGQSSLDFLIEWLSQGDKYKIFSLGAQHNNKKKAARICANWMQRYGCSTVRAIKQIQTKARLLYHLHITKHSVGP